MKRAATDPLCEEEAARLARRPDLRRHLLNEAGTSWVDVWQLPLALTPTPQQYEQLWALHPAEQGRVKMMGKLVQTPRWQQAYGQPYRFSGLDHPAEPMPALVQPLLDYANAQPEYNAGGGDGFNAALVNWYRDGAHHIGWHADDESQMVRRDGESLVFSLALGQEREFRLRPRPGTTGRSLSVPMPSGTCLVMGGQCQRTHQHSVPKVAGKKGAQLARRINVTFRQFTKK